MGTFFQSLAGKIATAVLSLAVVAAGFAWYETAPETRHAILADTGRLIGWLLLVLIIPWASFWAVAWVAKFRTNAAGAGLVLGFTLVEAIVLEWLFSWSVHGATEWVLYVAAILLAGVYNLFGCDWIAEKMEQG